MPTIMKTEEYIEELCSEEGNEEYEFVSEQEWISEGKYEWSSMIFKDKKGNFWQANQGRSGSHFTDWFYQYEPGLIQVEMKEVTIKKWIAVN